VAAGRLAVDRVCFEGAVGVETGKAEVVGAVTGVTAGASALAFAAFGDCAGAAIPSDVFTRIAGADGVACVAIACAAAASHAVAGATVIGGGGEACVATAALGVFFLAVTGGPDCKSLSCGWLPMFPCFASRKSSKGWPEATAVSFPADAVAVVSAAPCGGGSFGKISWLMFGASDQRA
jgi:hypothetical protein